MNRPNVKNARSAIDNYVGTLVGESTSHEFRLAVAHETLREQDIIAVDADLSRPTDNSDEKKEELRIWAKVQRIERLNPLFPAEAGHELAATRTNPLDTVLSLSREMVTAVCQVLGTEQRNNPVGAKLQQVRYPPRPASSAYRPDSNDVSRIVIGELGDKRARALDIASMSNRPEVDVMVDGHVIVTRHLAILAMTGAGKSWAARRIIEQLAEKHYPIVIFDPRGDYSGLAEVPGLGGRVRRYFAQFPLFDEDSETVANIVNNLGYSLTDTMRNRFSDVFGAAKSFRSEDPAELQQRIGWLAQRINRPEAEIAALSRRHAMWLLAFLVEAGESTVRDNVAADRQQLHDWGWQEILNYSATDRRTLEGIKKRARKAASVLARMEDTSRKLAGDADPLPTDRTELVAYDQISIVSLAGYSDEFRATIYAMVARDLFEARITGRLGFQVLFVLEEAHNFAPAQALQDASREAIAITRQIAQEGRKFGVGLVLISQRPSRLDETTLSQCNSFIVMRMVNPADQGFVRRVIESLGEEEARMLPDLDVGEAILSGQMVNFPVLVKIKEPVSKGEREEEDAFVELEKARQKQAVTSNRRTDSPPR